MLVIEQLNGTYIVDFALQVFLNVKAISRFDFKYYFLSSRNDSLKMT